MAETTIEALIDGGKASAGPPLGPALGPAGVNIGQVVAAINEKTKDFNGMQVPVQVIIESSVRSFSIEVGSPPASALVKKELGMERGSSLAKLEKAADAPIQAIIKVARMKHDSMLANDIKAATKEVLGTCVPLGILVEGKDPREVQKLVDAGEYDDYIEGKKPLDYDRDAMLAKTQKMQSALTSKKKEAAPAAADAVEEGAPAAANVVEEEAPVAEKAVGKAKKAGKSSLTKSSASGKGGKK